MKRRIIRTRSRAEWKSKLRGMSEEARLAAVVERHAR